MNQTQDQASIDLSKAFAQWIDRATLAWNTPMAGPFRCALEYAPGTSADDIIAGRGIAVPVHPVTGGLPE